jgi:hypothetical protein
MAEFSMPSEVPNATFSPTPVTSSKKRKYDIYLPSHSFEESAMCLDRLELKMAQVGVLRILKYLRRSRPVSRSARVLEAEVWRGHEQALIRYGIAVAKAYISHGGSDTVLHILKQRVVRGEWLKPAWVYEEQTRTVHQMYLVNIGRRRTIAKAIRNIIANQGFRMSRAEFLLRSNYPPILRTLEPYIVEDLKHRLCVDYNVNFRQYPNHYQQFGWDISSFCNLRLTECLH